MPLRIPLSMALVPCLAGLAVSARAAAPEKPNIVFVLIDDIGYGDIGPFGSTKNRTPQLDRMAKEGVRLNSFYAAPVCSVSRAQVLTGCYGQEHKGRPGKDTRYVKLTSTRFELSYRIDHTQIAAGPPFDRHVRRRSASHTDRRRRAGGVGERAMRPPASAAEALWRSRQRLPRLKAGSWATWKLRDIANEKCGKAG